MLITVFLQMFEEFRRTRDTRVFLDYDVSNRLDSTREIITLKYTSPDGVRFQIDNTTKGSIITISNKHIYIWQSVFNGDKWDLITIDFMNTNCVFFAEFVKNDTSPKNIAKALLQDKWGEYLPPFSFELQSDEIQMNLLRNILPQIPDEVLEMIIK